MDDSDGAALAELGQQRDALISRVTQTLQADERVVAAWLSGSFGRGEADAWSDLDLHVAVADEHYEALRETPQPLFEQCGRVLLVQAGFFSDSMPGGWFWLVLYPGPIEVDWNIGPASEAVRPVASQLLFERVAIPIDPPLEATSSGERQAQGHRWLTFFWAMAPIAVKYAGRGHTRRAVRQIDLMTDAYTGLWRVLWSPDRLHRDRYQQNRRLEPELDARLARLAATIDPAEALRVIRALCAEVEGFHAALSELGIAIPTEMPREVDALASIAEQAIQQGGFRPDAGNRRETRARLG